MTQDAHHALRRAARESIPPSQRRAAQRAFLAAAAARGIAVVHECAGPEVSGMDDLADLLAADCGVEVVGYGGQAVGAAASYAIWDSADFAGFPPAGTPSCLRTVHQGRILFDRESSLM